MIIALALFGATGIYAQSAYDAGKIAQEDLSGTARFVGMGGAMSALGGDISTIGTNPAGIGIYRSNDVMLTLGYSLTGTESEFGGNTFEKEKARWNLNNIGFVIANKFSNISPLRYVNFGFNYKKSKSFYKNMSMQGLLGSVSQTYEIAALSDGLTPEIWDDSRYGVFEDPDIGWLSALAYHTFLVGPSQTNTPTDYPLLDDAGNQLYDENGPLYEDYGYYASLVAGYNSTYGTFHSWERGGIDEYDFNVSFNINDRFYLGVTFGAYDVSYDKHTFYDENYGSGEGYFLESFNRIHGSGFDVKLGTIFRPIEASPLRIGLSVHTPIFYRLTYATGAYIQSDVYVDDDQSTTGLYVDTYEQLGNRDMEFDFRLQTPWVVNASVGYTVGNNLALGAEYEFENFSNMKFKDVNNYDMDPETDEVKYTLKGVHTFRLGAEYKPISAFAFRVGYNYSSTAYKADAYKNIFSNSVSTDTEYSNDKSRNTFTVGIGYRGSLFYADLAYKYDMYKSDFYPFYNNLEGVKMAATKVSNTRSQVLLTVGCRF